MDKEAARPFFRGFRRMRAGKYPRKKGQPKVPASFAKGVDIRHKGKALAAYKRQAGKTGPESFVSWLPTMAAEKMLGKKKVRDAMWKAIGKPALLADTAAGNVLKKIPGGKNLFTATEKVPWDNKEKFYRTIRRSSALAPLVKARNVAAPIIVGVAFEKGIGKTVDYARSKSNTSGQPMTKAALAEKLEDKDLREKAASAMLHLHGENKKHEKRAHALRLLYKQAEMGMIEIPSNYSELEEKLGALVNEDLVVFEKALEMSGGQMKLGELGHRPDPQRRNAEENFQASILNDFEDF